MHQNTEVLVIFPIVEADVFLVAEQLNPLVLRLPRSSLLALFLALRLIVLLRWPVAGALAGSGVRE
jgi:hypothetical protein